MLSEPDIEAAHPEAFDFAFGNLPAARRAEFNRHLTGCRHCQAVVDEYSEIGGIIETLPPHLEPPADLEDRTVTAMVAALAERRGKAKRRPDAEDPAATRAYPIPGRQPPSEPETDVQPIPQLRPPAELQAQPTVARLPVWRRHRNPLAAAVAVAAAAIVAAIVVPLSLVGGKVTTAQATAAIPLHVTAAARLAGYGAATGRATARQDASGSWNISLTVQHLKNLGDSQWYTCWYVSRTGQVTSAGTFQVGDSGSWTFPMTSAADPHVFRTMEITIGPPDTTGALAGTVILTGRTS